MIVSAVQMRPPKGNVSAARDSIQTAARNAATAGSRLIVFPEMATTGYVWQSPHEIIPHAEPAYGPTFEILSTISREYHTWITCGYAEHDGDRLFNSALVIDHNGTLAANYRKCLLYESDTAWAREGNVRMSIITPFGNLTPGICMDLNDDGFIKYLNGTNTTICAFNTNWIEEGIDVHGYWKARLEGFSGLFIAANSWGHDGAVSFCGGSAIIAPGGIIVARALSEGDMTIHSDICFPI
jgi:predicted amidohydrolase